MEVSRLVHGPPPPPPSSSKRPPASSQQSDPPAPPHGLTSNDTPHYPPQTSPSSYGYSFNRNNPRPPQTQQTASPIVESLPGPAMASLQHPSPSPSHVHTSPRGTWGPSLVSRQGSTPNMGPRSSHPPPPSQHVKPAMPGPARPLVAHPTADSPTPSRPSAHSPPTGPLPPGAVLSSSGVLILHEGTADEKARLQGTPGNPNGPAGPPPLKQRDQQDMELIRQAARDRDRERDRDRDRSILASYPPPTVGPGVAPPGLDRPISSPHDRPLAHPHDRSLGSPHDRTIPSPLERERAQHVHRMSPLARPIQTTSGPSARSSGPPMGMQYSPSSATSGPASGSQRMPMPPPPHHERERLPHDRAPPPPPLERDRAHPLSHGHNSGHAHPHAPPPPPHPHAVGPHTQHRPTGPGTGPSQFFAHAPPEWERDREKDREEREREYAFHSDMMRDRQRQRERERERDTVSGPGVPPSLAPPPSQREREMMDGPGMSMAQRERERELVFREREIATRDRERDRRTHSRVSSPHSHSLPHAHIPSSQLPHSHNYHAHGNSHGGPLRSGGVSGPGMPPPAGPSTSAQNVPLGIGVGPGVSPYGPHPHDLARERERERENHFPRQRERERDIPPIGLSERDQLVRECEREREREYRDRIAGADRAARERVERMERERIDRVERDRDRERERVGMIGLPMGAPHVERQPRDRVDREREQRVMADRERDRAPYEQRERDHMAFERDLQQHEQEREREHAMLERGGNKMIVVPMSVLDREREAERERERERVGHPAPYERDRERDKLPVDRERERLPLIDPERLEAMDRQREKERERMEVMEREREREREREQKERVKDRIVPAGHDRDDLGLGVANVGGNDKRDKQRELVPEAMDIDRPSSTDRDRLGLDFERERLEPRDRLELLEREYIELLERERLGTLDIVDRERLEMIVRERSEIIEREHIEMLERMPSAAELAKARKEREKKPFVNVGVYVWPRTPFPYYFPEHIPSPIAEDGNTVTAGAPVPTELRLTVIIPPTFLPPCRPPKFRLWGGGLPPPPPFLPSAAISPLSRRRVYTDDSNVIECAVHAGLLTWSGVARAKREGRAVQVVLALVPTLSSASGAVRGPAGTDGNGNGTNGAAINGQANGTASAPRTRTSTPLPLVASTSDTSNELTQPVYAGGVWANRFIGGWGEAFYGDPSAGRGEQTGQMSSFEEAEDDGRGCVSCGWGWGHDGSAFEVISVQVVEKGAHVAPGLGRRNRAQRLAEYAQRRADVLGLPARSAFPFSDMTNTHKRRRSSVDLDEMRKVRGAAESAVLTDEVRRMEVRTILFGVADSRMCKMGSGYKYDPLVLQCILFPHLHSTTIVGPPRKRWKWSAVADKTSGDTNTSASSVTTAVVLECPKEAYVVTCADGEDGSRKYALSLLEPVEKEKKLESTADADNVTTETRTTPPLATMKPASPKPPTEKLTTLVAPENPTSSGPSPSDPTKSTPSCSEMAEEGGPPVSSPTPRPQQPKLGHSSSETKLRACLHTLQSNLVETNFLFEKDAVIVKLPSKDNNTRDDKLITVDNDELKIMVLRWRWFRESTD
ncbi:hypothetical protein EDD16DRAFT_1667523 [Pisolithus croceorrhizus]|nr:hypothetical protein EDD16DRAFT_1667523 [Pisolithus croceorrhizus]KAI6130176.1 hypothetical protein EV401DRAFT_1924105 [Pisolithus croceorrhizus]